MGTKDVIYSIISNDEELKTIKYNTLTKKIEFNGKNMSDADMIDIIITIKDAMSKSVFKQDLFTPKILKSYVKGYAEEHSYSPNISKSEWYSKIETDDKGNVKKTFENVVNFITWYPKYKSRLNFNEFMSYENIEDKTIRDADILEIRLDTEKELGFDSPEKVESAVKYVCHQNSFNPFKDAIEDIVWDGQERMDDFFIKFIGVEDNKYNRSFTRKWFYALIKRLYEPGCPFDCMLIVYDAKQGTGKSKIVERLISALGINYGYDTTITCDNKDKDNVDKLNKAWIVGIDEMDDFLKKNPEQTKQFLSMSRDQARLSYARRSETYYRHCVFYGNSNLAYFLKDYTDGFERRYWVMDAHGEVHDSNWWKENLTDDYCKQVIAEAKYLYDTEPDYVYNVLDLEETEWLKKVQYTHKTLNNDDLLQDDIYDILNIEYNYDILVGTYDKWKNAVKDSLAGTYQSTGFMGSLKSYKVDVIPVKWLKKYVHEELKRTVSTQYLTALISNEWYYSKISIDKTQQCVYRRYGGSF